MGCEKERKGLYIGSENVLSTLIMMFSDMIEKEEIRRKKKNET